MSFTPRRYDEIVRDLLTTLTGGTVRESFVMPSGSGPILLNNRPVRRISHLEGVMKAGAAPDAREINYRFTPADFELISTTGDDNNKDAIRFREDGRRPVPGSSVIVNYYPVQTTPVPLTDLNVGSVTRTLLETVARELAMAYLSLEAVYKSAYLDTAEGPSLDKVTALVGLVRLPAGHPVVKVLFTRTASSAGRITIPTGTPLVGPGGARYLTSEPLTLEPGELSREVQAVGESTATGLVTEGQLSQLEVVVAGISSVTNGQPARRLGSPETDDELRRRARSALSGVVRGTPDALKFGLMSIRGVKDVAVIEMPNGVPGEIRIDIAYDDETNEVKAEVGRRIEELRPAGIRVLLGKAATRVVDVQVSLTLSGTGLPGSELSSLQGAMEQALGDHLDRIPPGGKVRRAQLTSLILRDPRVVDASVTLVPRGQTGVEELQLNPGEVLEVASVAFLPPTSEEVSDVTVTALVNAVIPARLLAGVTLADAVTAIDLALTSYLASRNSSQPITVDGMLAAIRDDTRFAAIRKEVIVTVEAGSSFMQLTDGVGAYTPGTNEILQKGQLDVQPREGV